MTQTMTDREILLEWLERKNYKVQYWDIVWKIARGKVHGQELAHTLVELDRLEEKIESRYGVESFNNVFVEASDYLLEYVNKLEKMGRKTK